MVQTRYESRSGSGSGTIARIFRFVVVSLRVELTLAAFSAAMIWMYFHKMKRADALVTKLAGNSTEIIPPPAGSQSASPPLASKNETAAVNPDIAPSKPNS